MEGLNLEQDIINCKVVLQKDDDDDDDLKMSHSRFEGRCFEMVCGVK